MLWKIDGQSSCDGIRGDRGADVTFTGFGQHLDQLKMSQRVDDMVLKA